MDASLYDLSPLMHLLGVGLLLALGPLAWVYFRHRSASPRAKFYALAWLTLFLTFDLVLFGAFTRLSDSGLGCPDWPGCYGRATPLGAHADIAAAQAAMPSGPVTHSKAWVEMVHRYLATGVGALTLAMLLWAWTMHWRKSAASGAREAISISPWWPTAIFVWTCVQGAFGALTVTMKLFPAIVTLHLLGGYTLLALLTAQLVLLGQSSAANHVPFALKVGMCFGLAVLVVQAASGAWVSTNYAVLACTEFPQCQGQWVPPMNFSQAFELWRPLGQTAAGEAISFQALTAIHVTHRTLAALALVVLGLVAYSAHQHQPLRRPARYLAALLALQIITGLSNVVLGWPMLAAVVHTGGAGAMVAVMVWMLTITLAPQQGRSSQ